MMHDHRPYQWLHAHDCSCSVCEQSHPSEPDQLTATHIAMLGFAGFVTGAGFSILYNPPAALASLAAIVEILL